MIMLLTALKPEGELVTIRRLSRRPGRRQLHRRLEGGADRADLKVTLIVASLTALTVIAAAAAAYYTARNESRGRGRS